MDHAGALNYLKSIGDLMDFRKAAEVSDVLLLSFSITEVTYAWVNSEKENEKELIT